MSIYSKKYRFCFVHIEKNAGTSIRDALSESLKVKHFKSRSYFGPMRGKGGVTVKEYIDFLGEEEYANHFSFAIVRNPYERMVSWYKYDNFGFDNFEDWIYHFFSNIKGKQTDYLKDYSENIAVDFIGRIENLQSDFNIITKRIGVGSITLKRKNSSKFRLRSSKYLFLNYRDFYTPELRNFVERELKEELDMFNYDF